MHRLGTPRAQQDRPGGLDAGLMQHGDEEGRHVFAVAVAVAADLGGGVGLEGGQA